MSIASAEEPVSRHSVQRFLTSRPTYDQAVTVKRQYFEALAALGLAADHTITIQSADRTHGIWLCRKDGEPVRITVPALEAKFKGKPEGMFAMARVTEASTSMDAGKSAVAEGEPTFLSVLTALFEAYPGGLTKDQVAAKHGFRDNKSGAMARLTRRLGQLERRDAVISNAVGDPVWRITEDGVTLLTQLGSEPVTAPAAPEPTAASTADEAPARRKLRVTMTAAQVQEAQRLYDNGHRVASIAAELGVSCSGLTRRLDTSHERRAARAARVERRIADTWLQADQQGAATPAATIPAPPTVPTVAPAITAAEIQAQGYTAEHARAAAAVPDVAPAVVPTAVPTVERMIQAALSIAEDSAATAADRLAAIELALKVGQPR